MTIVTGLKTDLASIANQRHHVLEHAVAAYWGLAIGDALGATVEFMTPREIGAAYGTHDQIIGGGWLHLKPGQVTDDTEMSLALGDAILDEGVIDPYGVAQAFSNWMSTKPVDIGHTVRRGIVDFRNKGIPHVDRNPHHGGNGACMRTLPVALFTLGCNRDQVSQASRVQSHVTHNCELSDLGTETVIAMVQHALVRQSSLKDLQLIANDLVQEQDVFLYCGRDELNPSGFIADTLKAVFQGLFFTDSFESCLINVVNRGGDADTTGAIAGMIAGALYGPKAIPTHWLQKLNKKIRKRCEEQATRLVSRSPFMKSVLV